MITGVESLASDRFYKVVIFLKNGNTQEWATGKASPDYQDGRGGIDRTEFIESQGLRVRI